MCVGISLLQKRLGYRLCLQTSNGNQVNSERERNKVIERLAMVASDRNIKVQVFVNFPEEMLDEFGFDKVVEFPFCLKALSTPEVIAAMDTTQLGTLIMKLGAANAKAT
ncbi:hypothetical protein Gogos_020486, partial [Gossypium gossypioides]|nr:hypothetical protein [Gossypium gossypioides]